jgi:hypothetical protein
MPPTNAPEIRSFLGLVGYLLPSVHKGFLQNRQTNDKVTREEQELRIAKLSFLVQ